MLEEKNDNLQEADGNLANNQNDLAPTENQEIAIETSEEAVETISEEAEIQQETSTETVEETTENVIELTDEQVADDTLVIETGSNSAVAAIESVNAEESEDETLKERHEIPMLDYETLSMEQMISELENLVTVEKVMSVKGLSLMPSSLRRSVLRAAV